MPNETNAREWLKKAWHSLSAAQLLLEANHYTDTIAVELPSVQEMAGALQFSKILFEKICQLLKIETKSIQ